MFDTRGGFRHGGRVGGGQVLAEDRGEHLGKRGSAGRGERRGAGEEVGVDSVEDAAVVSVILHAQQGTACKYTRQWRLTTWDS